MNKAKTKGMVDISEKEITMRVAKAESRIAMSARAFHALMEGESPKGDVFETAKVAGIMAAKSTPAMIPMCHPLPLNKVNVGLFPDQDNHQVIITTEVVCLGRTGVEMEAMAAASIAALTIYDMMKWADKGMVITETRLLHKSGGKSGEYNA